MSATPSDDAWTSVDSIESTMPAAAAAGSRLRLSHGSMPPGVDAVRPSLLPTHSLMASSGCLRKRWTQQVEVGTVAGADEDSQRYIVFNLPSPQSPFGKCLAGGSSKRSSCPSWPMPSRPFVPSQRLACLRPAALDLGCIPQFAEHDVPIVRIATPPAVPARNASIGRATPPPAAVSWSEGVRPHASDTQHSPLPRGAVRALRGMAHRRTTSLHSDVGARAAQPTAPTAERKAARHSNSSSVPPVALPALPHLPAYHQRPLHRQQHSSLQAAASGLEWPPPLVAGQIEAPPARTQRRTVPPSIPLVVEVFSVRVADGATQSRRQQSSSTLQPLQAAPVLPSSSVLTKAPSFSQLGPLPARSSLHPHHRRSSLGVGHVVGPPRPSAVREPEAARAAAARAPATGCKAPSATAASSIVALAGMPPGPPRSRPGPKDRSARIPGPRERCPVSYLACILSCR